jgi:hypothetical protein
LDSIDEGKLRISLANDEAAAEAQRRMEEETASNEAAWAPILAKIKDSTPEWAWQYLTHPHGRPTYYSGCVTMIVPAAIDLEAMGTVFVYVGRPKDDPPCFLPAEWRLSSDDEEGWSVCPSNGRSETVYSLPDSADFLVALAQAHENMAENAELKAEASRRNAQIQKPTVETPATRAEHDWLGLARIAVGEAREGGSQAAIAYALIGVLELLVDTR